MLINDCRAKCICVHYLRLGLRLQREDPDPHHGEPLGDRHGADQERIQEEIRQDSVQGHSGRF